MERFTNWYIRNQDAISWFLIGWLSMGMLNAINDQQYIWAAIDAVMVYANYKLISVRL